MKGALAVYKLVPRKMDDGGTISALPDNAMPLSNPNPTVTISSAEFTALEDAYQTNPDVVQGNFTITGSLGSYICDVTPGDQGKIDEVSIYLNTGDQPVVAQVQANKGQGRAPRKYPFSGIFNATVPANVHQGPNKLIVRAKDKVLGKVGSAEVVVDVRRDGSADPSPGREATGGFAQISQPLFAEMDLSGSDPTAIEAGSASLSVSVTNLLNSTQQPITDTLVKSGIRTVALKGQRLALRLNAGLLSAAKAGTIDTFQATVDCAEVTWKERPVTFRRVNGSHFVTDYFTCTIVGDGGVSGSDPVTITLQRGGDGQTRTATLTKQAGSWISSDGDLTVALAPSASSDGVRGTTATITSSSLSITAYSVQAVESSTVGTFSSTSVVGIGNAGGNDREAVLGSVHPTYAEVAYSNTDEQVTSLAIEIEGAEEIVGKQDFTIPTLSGDRKLAKKSGKYYLASSDGSEPESLMFISKGDLPAGTVGIDPPKKDDQTPPRNGAGAYALGFGAGVLGGGGALVTGTLQFVAGVVISQVDDVKLRFNLLLSTFSEPAADRAQAAIDKKVATVEGIADVTKTAAGIMAKLNTDELALYEAIINDDDAEKERILGEYAIYMDLASEFFNEVMDKQDALDDYHKGVVAGRIFFETVLIVLPFTKAAQAGQAANTAGAISKATVMTRLSERLNALLPKFPLELQATVSRVIAKVNVITQQMKGATWVAKYGRDGERIFTLKYHYQVRGGHPPLEALKLVEKNHKNLNKKGLMAAMIDAMVEEKGLDAAGYYVRKDGARVPRTAFTYIDSNARDLEAVRTGKLPARPESGPGKRGPRYSSFDRYDTSSQSRDKLQLPDNDGRIRVEYDTRQALNDYEVPNGFWNKGDKLEPLTNSYPVLGAGGATQVTDRAERTIRRAINIDTGEILYEAP